MVGLCLGAWVLLSSSGDEDISSDKKYNRVSACTSCDGGKLLENGTEEVTKKKTASEVHLRYGKQVPC